MPRYIDTTKLLWIYEHECEKYSGLDEMVADVPTEDVVEVVRCKDCRHIEIINGQEYYARCKWHGRLFSSFGNADTRTWFCADGERRDDGSEKMS